MPELLLYFIWYRKFVYKIKLSIKERRNSSFSLWRNEQNYFFYYKTKEKVDFFFQFSSSSPP